MNTGSKPSVRWSLAAAYLGMALMLGACGAVTAMPAEAALLRLNKGAVEARGEDHVWVPVGGETTFELVGSLENTHPWQVTGNTFAVRDATQITEGLQVGDAVKVKGVILEDATWLARSIEPAAEKSDPAITLIGKVDSINPWIVSGIRLPVTGDTIVTRKIAPDMLVRADILLLEDGTWKILRLALLSTFTEIPGCNTITATVARVNGKQVQFAGWPVLSLGKDVQVEDEAGNQVTLSANRAVLVVACSTDGQFTITKIVVLRKNGDASGNGERVMVCHKPDKKGRHTLHVAAAAVPAHLRHGDTLGSCP